MDIITHALSGATFTYALPQRFRQWWFPIWGMFVGIIPDADLLFVISTADYLTIHRGVTHSFAGAWGLSFLCALPLVFLTSLQPATDKLPPQKNAPWSLLGAWFFAYVILLQHIWLDVMNSYGTQIFLPFNERKIYLNGLFIVDLLLLVPLLLGVIFWRKRSAVMIALLGWTIVYPLISLGIKFGLETYLQRNYDRPAILKAQSQKSEAASNLPKVRLLPEALSPLYWKLVLSDNEAWNVANYIAFTKPPKEFLRIEKPSPEFLEKLKKQIPLFSEYSKFALFLGVSVASTDREKIYAFKDLRFSSTVPFVQRLQEKRLSETEPFQFLVVTDANDTPLSIRFTGTGTGGDTGLINLPLD